MSIEDQPKSKLTAPMDKVGAEQGWARYLPSPIISIFVAMAVVGAFSGLCSLAFEGQSVTWTDREPASAALTGSQARFVDQPALLFLELSREHSPSPESAVQHAGFLDDVCRLLEGACNPRLKECRTALLVDAENLRRFAPNRGADTPTVSDESMRCEIRKAIALAGQHTMALHSNLQMTSPAEKDKLIAAAGPFLEEIKKRIVEKQDALENQLKTVRAFTVRTSMAPDDDKTAFRQIETLCMLCREIALLAHLLELEDSKLKAIIDLLYEAGKATLAIAESTGIFSATDSRRATLRDYAGNIELRRKILLCIHDKCGKRIAEMIVTLR